MRALTTSQLLAWNPPFQPYIIDKGILPVQTKMIVFGKFESWKSMIAMHTAYTLAEGRPWFGFKTVKASSYTLQSEIPMQEHRKRIAKYVRNNDVSQVSMDSSVAMLTDMSCKIDKPFYVSLMEKDMLEFKPNIFILDPIYSTTSGRLTDEYDVRRFVDRMNYFIDKFKLTLILIHHERKSQVIGNEIFSSSEDIFGSSILIDWCDTAIRTSKISDNGNIAKVQLSFDKCRHAEERLHPITVTVLRDNLTFRL